MKHPKDVRYDARPARSKLIPCGLEGGSVALCVGELEDMASPPGLLAVTREKMRTRHLALRTEHAYLQWLRRYLVFHGRRHPRHLGAPEVEQFLTHLAVHRKSAPPRRTRPFRRCCSSTATCCRSNCRGSTTS